MKLNIYHEARSEPIYGQFAVAQVTLNRAKRDLTKVCDVVRARSQFSWTLKPTGVKEREAWAHAEAVARLSIAMPDFTGGADHYHHISIYPDWAPKMEVKGNWGDHIFYQERRKR